MSVVVKTTKIGEYNRDELVISLHIANYQFFYDTVWRFPRSINL